MRDLFWFPGGRRRSVRPCCRTGEVSKFRGLKKSIRLIGRLRSIFSISPPHPQAWPPPESNPVLTMSKSLQPWPRVEHSTNTLPARPVFPRRNVRHRPAPEPADVEPVPCRCRVRAGPLPCPCRALPVPLPGRSHEVACGRPAGRRQVRIPDTRGGSGLGAAPPTAASVSGPATWFTRRRGETQRRGEAAPFDVAKRVFIA
jgi:hypothetical protein